MATNTLNSLFSALQENHEFDGLKKQFSMLEKKEALPDLNIPQNEIDRIHRVDGYNHAVRAVSNWGGFIQEQRRRETVSFPANFQTRVGQNIAQYAHKSSLKHNQTTFDKELAAVLPPSEARLMKPKSGSHGQFRSDETGEELPLVQLTAEELKQKQEHLAKLKAVLSYQAKKSTRQNKIKSKKYRKMVKRDKEKKDKKSQADTASQPLTLTQEEEAIEEQLRQRAVERATLRHKNTSRWIQRQMQMARRGGQGLNETTKEGILEQLRKGEELRKKIGIGLEEKDEEEEESDEESDDPLDLVRQIRQRENNTTRDDYEEMEGDGEHEGVRLVDRELTQRELKQNKQFVDSANKAISENKGLFALQFMKNALREQIEQAGGTVEEKKKAPAADEWTRDEEDEEEATEQNPWTAPAVAQLVAQRKEAAEKERAKGRTKGAEQKKAGLDVNGLLDTMQQSSEKRTTFKTLFEQADEQDKEAVDSSSKQPAKKSKNEQKKSKMSVPDSDEDSEDDPATGRQSFIAKAKREEPAVEKVKEDGKTRRVERSSGLEEDSDVNSEAEESEDENEESDEDEGEGLGSLVMGDDEEEFAEEKRKEIEGSAPKEVTTVLPGWNFWVGDGCSAPSHIPKRAVIVKKKAGVSEQDRRDRNLPRVIISEKKDKVFEEHYTVGAVPFGYENKQAYDYAMGRVEGIEWNRDQTYKKNIQPRVVVHKGTVVDPLRWNKAVANAGPKKKEVMEKKKAMHVEQAKQRHQRKLRESEYKAKSKARNDISLHS
ncbi:putative small-subunit processome [Blattamonas nauphoetae]|uniref:Small-subunit processome n=1 Tax=Blattamonas nauphoetae TaxID=2049346 RepID=A0ABQ9YKD8_9EUKA|nr:putative small-subunit processome [Blattamonas nauphoetae]